MSFYDSIAQAIDADLPDDHRLMSQVACPKLQGDGGLNASYVVSEFSQAGIATAIDQLQQLRFEYWGVQSLASVDRALSTQWCQRSVLPIGGWSLPSTWDEFAADYATADGWIRLHTNAPHHQRAALRVLDNPTNKQLAAAAVRQWTGEELESAVVQAGGAAAVMRSVDQWAAHAQGRSVASEPVVAWQVRNNEQATKQLLPELSDVKRPLKGLRVLDLTRVLAGPVCTRFLASFGASVLRIDPPSWQENSNVLEMTVGKRCAGLDLTIEKDRQVFAELLSQAHVLVHGYRADALESLGVGAQWRRSTNPQLIETALNAYGWTGPWVNRRGFDSLVQMSSGIAHRGQLATKATAPVPLPFQALDHVTGYLMAAATLYAVRLLLSQYKIGSTRLSLARQAALLQQFPAVEAAGDLRHLENKDVSAKEERSPYGRMHRYRFPYSFTDIDPFFDVPVSDLRSSPASWSDTV